MLYLLGVVINQNADRVRLTEVLKAKDSVIVESQAEPAANRAVKKP